MILEIVRAKVSAKGGKKGMKIALCDDCRDDIMQLEKLIKKIKYCSENQYFFEYLSGEELLNNYMDFDLIILDMCIGEGLNGVETARNIRKRDAKVIIMFYSDYESKANKISSVRPSNYILKKYSNEEILQNLDSCFGFIILSNDSFYRVNRR